MKETGVKLEGKEEGRCTLFLFTVLVSFFPAAENSYNTSDAQPPVGYATSGTEEEQKHASSTGRQSHTISPSTV